MPYQTTFSLDSVFVIESLRPGELKTASQLWDATIAPHRFEQNLLGRLYTPSSRGEFLGALGAVKQHAAAGHAPVLHIEAHGNEEGLELGSGERILWTDLGPFLAAINQASRMNLLVIAAACRGWHLTEALRPTGRAPAWGVLGPPSDVGGEELHEAMKRFYDALLPKLDLTSAMRALNDGIQISNWTYRVTTADLLYCRSFRAYLQSLLDEESQTERVNRLVAEVARARSLDVLQTSAVRADFRQALDDHGFWYEKYKHEFLMLDLFPENAERFPLSLADCLPRSA